MKKRYLMTAMLTFLGAAGVGFAEVDINKYADEGVPRLSKYLQIDTINPPGNEQRGVEYLAEIFSAAGLEYETAESAPGRGNLWVKLPATSKRKQPGLVLLHHIDVVPDNRTYWSFDPLSGEVKDGWIYGRGAIDTKGLGIAQLQAFLALHASGKKLNRDVWYMATADEEAGGFFGAGWLVENRPELFKNVGYVLNEGGSARKFGDTTAVLVEVTQKVPLWLKLTAFGQPGHGSAPLVETSVTKMVRALKRIAETEFPVRVLPPVADMLEGIAPFQAVADQQLFAGHPLASGVASRFPLTGVNNWPVSRPAVRSHPGTHSEAHRVKTRSHRLCEQSQPADPADKNVVKHQVCASAAHHLGTTQNPHYRSSHLHELR